MYELTVIAHFSAAHQLRDCGGACEHLHGHNWRVDVVVRGEEPRAGGMVIDFRILKAETQAILETVDHRYLNDLEYFQKVEPSSEGIARYIFEALEQRLSTHKVQLYKVTAWESEGTAASYLKTP